MLINGMRRPGVAMIFHRDDMRKQADAIFGIMIRFSAGQKIDTWMGELVGLDYRGKK